jgi:gas vesicle protein
MKTLDILLAFVGGAIVGAAAGVLFAPKKGEETRKEIKDYLESKGIKLKGEKLERLVDEIKSEVESVEA